MLPIAIGNMTRHSFNLTLANNLVDPARCLLLAAFELTLIIQPYTSLDIRVAPLQGQR